MDEPQRNDEFTILSMTFVGVEELVPGDYNADCIVSQGDLDLVLLNWGSSTLPQGWANADQFDGVITQNELDAVLLNWGDGAVSSFEAVPEPSSIALVALCGALHMSRLRRKPA